MKINIESGESKGSPRRGRATWTLPPSIYRRAASKIIGELIEDNRRLRRSGMAKITIRAAVRAAIVRRILGR